MELIRRSISPANPLVPSIELPVDRHTLAKRRWRGVAADGCEFGFDLERPLANGDCFHQSATASYVIAQASEPLLEVPVLSPVQAAKLAWQVGNLHFPLAIMNHHLWIEDDLAIRQMLVREKILFREIRGVFQPIAAVASHHHH